MKYLFTLSFVIISLSAFSQYNNKKSFEVGIGSFFMANGGFRGGSLETEFAYKLNRYFTTSIGSSTGFGSKGYHANHSLAYQQGNWNIFVSPFQNTELVHLKIGTGISANWQWEKYARLFNQIENSPDFDDYKFNPGANFIIELTFDLQNNYLFTFKGFTQPFVNGDTSSGFSFKIGKYF